MAIFTYRGRNKRGELMRGEIDSSSAQAVAWWMTSAGITPVAIQAKPAGRPQPQWLRSLQGQRAPTDVDLLLFTRQMGSMVKAGVPMLQALEGVQKSTGNQRLSEILGAIRNDLDRGLELSTAMAHHPKFFSDYYVSMVRVGETSGQLDEIFGRLFAQLEFEKAMKEKIKSALRYPTFVIMAIAVAIVVLNLYVIPVFANVYSSMKVALPPLTRALIGMSKFTVSYWWAMLAAIVIAVFAFRTYTSKPEGRYRWDKTKLKFPIVGRILVKAAIARFTLSFATASKSGVPLIQAFTLVSRVVDNAFYEQRILQMRDGVERGESILRVAQSAGIFAPLELQMIAVGEETGEVDEMMRQVASMYQQEVDYEVGRLSQAIEPLLIGFMGVLVAVLMLGIFLPLWDLGQMAHQK